MDLYFSADVETDGPIPGPYSMLSFGIVFAGRSTERSSGGRRKKRHSTASYDRFPTSTKLTPCA